jgi:hypothetical protein
MWAFPYDLSTVSNRPFSCLGAPPTVTGDGTTCIYSQPYSYDYLIVVWGDSAPITLLVNHNAMLGA